MKREPNCVFCDIVAGTEPASVVFEDDDALAFMNRAQFNAGHVLVIPKQHRVDIREFEPALGAAVMNAVSDIARAVTAAFSPDGLTVQHNIGEAGGQDVFHAHFHVQPATKRTAFTAFIPRPRRTHPAPNSIGSRRASASTCPTEHTERTTAMSEERLIVTAESSIEEAKSRGDLHVRRVFEASSMPFESGFQFVLRNRLPAGTANERHIHEDVEKVYYFLSGAGEVSCGPWTKRVGPGDFLFFPAAIEHEIHADADADLEFIVCAAQTLGTPRGLG